MPGMVRVQILYELYIDSILRRHHHNNLGCAILVEKIHSALFSEVRILDGAAFTPKPIDHQHGERGINILIY